MNINSFVSRLDGVQKSGNGWEAQCPAHDDRSPSLSVSEGRDGRVLVKCFAGCSAEDVLAALGLKMSDLYQSPNGTGKRPEHRWAEDDAARALHLRGLRPETIREFGITADLRKQAWQIPIGSGIKFKKFCGGTPKYWWEGRKPSGADIYGLDLLPSGTSHVYLVEGEPDAWIAHQAGLRALTFTCGAETVPKAGVRALVDAQIGSVTVVYDKDGAGDSGAQKAARALLDAGLEVEIRRLPDDLPVGSDLTDLYNAVDCDDAAFCELVSELKLMPVEQQRHDSEHEGRPTIQVHEERAAESGKRDFTHDGLALCLGDRWRDDARYVHIWGRWYFWDGSIWCVDNLLDHLTRTRAFLRVQADSLGPDDDKAATRLRQADTVAKVAGLARSNAAQAASVEQWDADPWLLGTPGGTVDLQTGVLRAACHTDYITKQAAVTPAPEGTPAPLWTKFLERITSGDAVLQAYLQRFFGYTLTGSIRENVFVFGYGTGANGKSVCVNTVQGILGAYALSIPSEMLMVGQADRHPTELARLRGIRLAVGSETEQGKQWAESKIKRLTGGDKIPARFMHRDFFEFEPEFKLLIVGNQRPSLRGVDEAMRRRFHLVPFTVTIPKKERDRDLPGKLKEEWPAIFRWIISGCLDWQREGLDPPESVRAATEEYLEAEDALNIWLEDCTEVDVNGWEPSGNLFAAWKDWAEAAGEYVGSQKRLSGLLRERGFTPERLGGSGIRGFRGLRLRPEEGRARGEP